MSEETNTRRYLAWWFLFLGLSFLCYGAAIPGGFIWDENTFLKNALLRRATGVLDFWLRPQLNPYESHYWPVTYTGFWLQAQLFGLKAPGFKIVSVVLHSIVCLLVLVLLRRLDVPAAKWAALVFCVHPVHVESVCWPVEQKGLLASIFGLAALIVFPISGRGGGRVAASGALFALGLLSKSSIVPLPVVMALLLWWKRRRLARDDVLSLLPLLVVAIVYAVLDLWSVRGREILPEVPSLWLRVVIAVQAVGAYMAALVWPVGYATIYPKWDALSANWQTASAVGFVVLAGLAVKRAGRGGIVAVVSYVILLAPVLGLIPFYFLSFSYMADRFQYLASMPLLALLVAAVATMLGRRYRWVGVVVVGLLSVSSMYYSWFWSDTERFWRRQVDRNPALAVAKNNLALELHMRGKLEESERFFLQAIDTDPKDYRAHSNLGALYSRTGRIDAAITQYQTAIELRPDHAESHNNLGLSLQQRGEFEGARRHFDRAIQIAPNYANAHVNLGALSIYEGKREEAARHFRRALQIDPSHPIATRNLRRLQSRP